MKRVLDFTGDLQFAIHLPVIFPRPFLKTLRSCATSIRFILASVLKLAFSRQFN